MNTPNSNSISLETIAAFGGLILGVFNLIFLLYKEFWKKGMLNASIEKSEIKRVEEGLYDVQISILLSASRGDIYLKEIKLANKDNVFGSHSSSNHLVFNRVYQHTREDLLGLKPDEFKKKITQEMNPKAILVRDLKISNNSQTPFTIVDRIESARYPDGWDDLPADGWELRFEFGSTYINVPMKLVQRHSYV